MAKVKTSYVCSQCGYETSKWNGKCPNCGEWNTFEEVELAVRAGGAKSKPTTVRDISDKIVGIDDVDASYNEIRYATGLKELDRVLGGGLVKGSLVLLGGEPGIGKSTMLLQICQYLGQDHTILYVSGEESVRQIKLRANRLHVDSENLYLLADNDCEQICSVIVKEKPEIVIIDSIQTMSISGISSAQGSVTQVRECTNMFMRTAKSEEIPMFIVGHVNKDGAIAGPKVMEHIVDCVLCIALQGSFSYDLLGVFLSDTYSTIADSGLSVLYVLASDVSLFSLFFIILFGYCTVKVVFANIKRGGIMLCQIAVGSIYMIGIPRGFTDGFSSWCKQVIATCLTAFLQTVILYLGLLTYTQHPLIAVGICLSATEVPRIAQMYGLDTSVRVNMMSVSHTVSIGAKAVGMLKGGAK